MKIFASLSVIVLLSVFGSAYALESGSTYFLDDSEFISILIEVDSQGNASFEEVFITPEGNEGEFVMDSSGVVSAKISSDHSYGKIIGHTINGDVALVIFHIDGEDVQLFAKVWTDDEKVRVIAEGEVISLF